MLIAKNLFPPHPDLLASKRRGEGRKSRNFWQSLSTGFPDELGQFRAR
jgi:hypothetical protein